MPQMKAFASKKDLHLAAVLPFWDCFKQNSGFEVPWNTLVVWMRLPIHDSRLRYLSVQLVQSLSCVRLFETPWTAARPASLSITNSWSLLKFTLPLVHP